MQTTVTCAPLSSFNRRAVSSADLSSGLIMLATLANQGICFGVKSNISCIWYLFYAYNNSHSLALSDVVLWTTLRSVHSR